MTLKKAVIFVGRELYITLTSHSRCLSAGADKLTGAELLLDQAELRHVGECESLRESCRRHRQLCQTSHRHRPEGRNYN